MTQTTGKPTLGIKNRSQYLELLNAYSPRPITSESELIATQKVIDSLVDQTELTPDQLDYLNVLGTLVREYETLNHPIPKLNPIDLINALLEESNLDPQALIPLFQNETIVSDILNGKQDLTLGQVKKLAHFFKINPTAFLG
jgi:HTH-type transcriptional regulator/antitoxin HigA